MEKVSSAGDVRVRGACSEIKIGCLESQASASELLGGGGAGGLFLFAEIGPSLDRSRHTTCPN